MHTFVDKFYLNDNLKNNRFTQFGAFPSMSNTSLFQNGFNKSTSNIALINNGTHGHGNGPGQFGSTQPQPLNHMIPLELTANNNTYKSPFVNTGKSVFLNSTAELGSNQIPRYTKEFHKTNQEIAQEEKKNTTKLQMMEEKMRGLELKSQRLEVINDFFFDMFENNLVKEELKRNQLEQDQMNEYGDDNDYYDENEDYINNTGFGQGLRQEQGQGQAQGGRNKKRQMKRKGKTRKEEQVLPTSENMAMPKNQLVVNKQGKDKEFDPKEFQQKTLKNATKIMKNLKKSVSDYILEEQLKKNEEMQSITEEIFEIKSDLQNKVRRLQEKQRIQMEGLAFVLQNAGNPKIEALAQRILSSQYYDFQNDNNTMLMSPKKEGQFDDSPSYRKGSVSSSIKRGRRQSIAKNNKSPLRMSHVGMINEEDEFAPQRKSNELSPIEKKDSLKKSPKRTSSPPKSPKKAGSPKKSSSPRKSQMNMSFKLRNRLSKLG